MVSAERTARVRRLFEKAASHPPAEREAVLSEGAQADPTLRRPVEALLALDRQVSRPASPADVQEEGEAAHWEALKAVFEAACERAPAERAAYLDAACGGDAALRAEVESLLAYDDEAPAYFDGFAEALEPLWDAAKQGPYEAADAPDPLIGQRVRHYAIQERLGGGGMGVVYKARDERLDRTVALKFLPPHLSGDEAARTRFVHEAKAASALDHPHIATVHDIGQADDGRLFIVMACYDGETLKAKAARGPLPPDEALGYTLQIAGGLVCAHAAGIVHRDVKPANVMVTEKGVVKIVDFGLAKVHDVTLTQTGATLGTVAYMSPEQARGEAVDHRTDLWSLGVVLYKLLTGENPFPGLYSQSVLYAVLNEAPTPLLEANPDVPPAVEAVVEKCLQKDPAARYQDAAALQRDLQQLRQGSSAESASASASASVPASAPAPAWRVTPLHRVVRDLAREGRLTPLAAVAALAVVLLLALNWFAAEPAPEARRLAVLPLRTIGAAADAEVFSAGLLESLTSRLSRLERLHDEQHSDGGRALWVVPAAEIDGPMKPSEARDRLGATHVVTGSVQVEAGLTRLTLNLVDVVTQRVIGTDQIDHRSTSTLGLQDEAALMLARMLRVTLGAEGRQALTAGGTTTPQANEFYLRGQGYLRQHQSLEELEKAIELFERAIEKDAQFALAHAGLGQAYWSKYRLSDEVEWAETAVEHSRHALELNDQLAPVYVTLGIIHSGRQQYEAALEAFGKALALDPANAEAYRRRAIVYRRQGRFDEAEAAYRQAIALNPGYWKGYNSLGVFYYLTGRYQDAVAQYAHGLALAPSNQRLLLNTGAAYWQMERLGEAVQTFERVLEIDAGNGVAKSNLATAYFYQARFEDAARLYEEELTQRPHDRTVQGFLADAYHWSPGGRGRARQAYRKAIAMTREHLALSEHDPDLLGSLAGYYARLGVRDTALVFLKQLEAALQPEKADVVTAFGVGEIYESLGDRGRALVWMSSALERGYGWIQVQHSPWLRALRQDPDFQKQLAAYRAKRADE